MCMIDTYNINNINRAENMVANPYRYVESALGLCRGVEVHGGYLSRLHTILEPP
jgi:hypothetical protein